MTDCVQELSANQLVNLYLMSSYLYYEKNISPVEDSKYDMICRCLLLKFGEIDHQHKYLIDKDALRAGTAFHIGKGDYPLMVQHAAFAWKEAGSPIAKRRIARRSRVRSTPDTEKPAQRKRRRRI